MDMNTNEFQALMKTLYLLKEESLAMYNEKQYKFEEQLIYFHDEYLDFLNKKYSNVQCKYRGSDVIITEIESSTYGYPYLCCKYIPSDITFRSRIYSRFIFS